MTWEEFKKKLKELGVEVSYEHADDSHFTIRQPDIGLSKVGDIYTDCGDGYCDYYLAKGMPYEEVYKVVEILHKYRRK